MIARQRGGARQVAAEGVDRDGIGAVQPAHEIGDGLLRVHEATVHEIAGIEEDEHVGADEGIGPFHARQGVPVGFQERAGGAVLGDRQRRLGALAEGGDPLWNAVLENTEIGGLQSVDIVTLVIGHLKTEHHHIDLDTEDGALPAILRADGGAGRGHCKKSSSRNRHDGLPGMLSTIAGMPFVRLPGRECARGHRRPPGAGTSARPASLPGARRRSVPPGCASTPGCAR